MNDFPAFNSTTSFANAISIKDQHESMSEGGQQSAASKPDMNKTMAVGNSVAAATPSTPAKDSSKEMTLLPPNFTPSPHDVICGRGSRVYMYIGNERFRRLVAGRVEDYVNAETKLEKSYILYDVVAQVRAACVNGGGFVKKCNKTQRWYEVGDFIAREKTSQCFRDALDDQYKSSNGNKKRRRRAAERMILEQGKSAAEARKMARKSRQSDLLKDSSQQSEGSTRKKSAKPAAVAAAAAPADAGSDVESLGSHSKLARSVLDDPFADEETGFWKSSAAPDTTGSSKTLDLPSKKKGSPDIFAQEKPSSPSSLSQLLQLHHAQAVSSAPGASLFAMQQQQPTAPVLDSYTASAMEDKNSIAAVLGVGSTGVLNAGWSNTLPQTVAPAGMMPPNQQTQLSALLGGSSFGGGTAGGLMNQVGNWGATAGFNNPAQPAAGIMQQTPLQQALAGTSGVGPGIGIAAGAGLTQSQGQLLLQHQQQQLASLQEQQQQQCAFSRLLDFVGQQNSGGGGGVAGNVVGAQLMQQQQLQASSLSAVPSVVGGTEATAGVTASTSEAAVDEDINNPFEPDPLPAGSSGTADGNTSAADTTDPNPPAAAAPFFEEV